MGAICTPNYANIVMGKFERNFIYSLYRHFYIAVIIIFTYSFMFVKLIFCSIWVKTDYTIKVSNIVLFIKRITWFSCFMLCFETYAGLIFSVL